jgi:hypothetical protein
MSKILFAYRQVRVANYIYEGFGFGQVCSYGIGCGYIIKANTITYNCTTRILNFIRTFHDVPRKYYSLTEHSGILGDLLVPGYPKLTEKVLKLRVRLWECSIMFSTIFGKHSFQFSICWLFILVTLNLLQCGLGIE